MILISVFRDKYHDSVILISVFRDKYHDSVILISVFRDISLSIYSA